MYDVLSRASSPSHHFVTCIVRRFFFLLSSGGTQINFYGRLLAATIGPLVVLLVLAGTYQFVW